jgi:hypothetical protein
MSFDAPKAPDPTATSNAQQQYNTTAAKTQNNINSYGQSTPFGSVSYVADSSQPSGYRIVTDVNNTGHTLLNTADALANNTAGMYSQPFNGNNQAVTDKLNQWSGQYLQPLFDQQNSNLEAQLRSQGLTPGSEAYNNAKNLQARNQGDVTTNYLTKNQQQAFDQALAEYQQPQQTIAALRSNASPGAFQASPTATVQPPNYSGAVQQNYQNDLQNYENTWNNIGKLGTAAVGLAAAPFTGGTSLLGAGALGGMFGGGGSGITGWNSYGGNTFPQIGGGWG